MWQKFFKMDLVLLFSVFLLVAIGLISIYSISAANENAAGLGIFQKQLIYVLIGTALMLWLSFGNYQTLRTYSNPIYFSTLAVLLFVLFVGKSVRGTSGWIGFGPFQVQPVELAKISLIIFLASFISEKKTQLGEIGRLVASAVLCGAIIFLVLKQPDFGSAMVLAATWGGVTIVSGIKKKTAFSLVLIVAVAAIIGWFSLAAYQKDRILNLFNPGFDPKGSGYNVRQAVIAVGSGGIIGKGVGHGSQSQLNFLPEKHTDFIFAVVAEELGLVGSFLVLTLFLVFLFRVRNIARGAPNNFSYLVSVGILVMVATQMLENIGMNMAVMPVTGIPLPFVSYGGSSLIAMFICVGILQSIYMRKEHLIDVRDSY